MPAKPANAAFFDARCTKGACTPIFTDRPARYVEQSRGRRSIDVIKWHVALLQSYIGDLELHRVHDRTLGVGSLCIGPDMANTEARAFAKLVESELGARVSDDGRLAAIECLLADVLGERQLVPSMDKPPISRGFRSTRQAQTPRDRVPPGQYVTADFPVLSAGPTPQIALDQWTFELEHDGAVLATWNWSEFEALPQTAITADIHCVTKWSKLDTRWQGVTFDDLLKAAGLPAPPAPYVLAQCEGGYTTNLPAADLVGGKGAIVTRYRDAPIQSVHGGPARLLVPHLYFWKSAKWVRSLLFLDHDERGFWEGFGYHNYGDPWKEQRYDGDR